jgi:hypothetical protein
MKTHLKLPALLTLLAICLSGCVWYGPGGYHHHDDGGGYGGGYHHGY